MAATSSFVALVLLFLSTATETRLSSHKDNEQVLQSLFGPHLAALIKAPPSSDDITEGSAIEPTAPPLSERPILNQNNDSSKLVRRQGAVPQLLLDFLRTQTKTVRRGRKSMFGGRGCFGMKLDRIGSISGLGC
ncbi:C-type natriuretic peptide 2 [Austrofundulus limnaeus]|uniref:C-type natriuretic peptide 2 n=1 Tax=Austrofundulus limnaeus TaxID=52670 RepID=A0A2I4D6L5_AUSLI|nr:PREDICTED: C-type natriuretic peptide 2-like [Austrofundulus limnaeus]